MQEKLNAKERAGGCKRLQGCPNFAGGPCAACCRAYQRLLHAGFALRCCEPFHSRAFQNRRHRPSKCNEFWVLRWDKQGQAACEI